MIFNPILFIERGKVNTIPPDELAILFSISPTKIYFFFLIRPEKKKRNPLTQAFGIRKLSVMQKSSVGEFQSFKGIKMSHFLFHVICKLVVMIFEKINLVIKWDRRLVKELPS